MFPIHDFTLIDEAFPDSVLKFMPPRKEIPREFLHSALGKKYARLCSDWFFSGLKSIKWFPRPGVDKDKATRHLRCILGSFEPQHEHKEEAFAYLCDQWFEDIKWECKE